MSNPESSSAADLEPIAADLEPVAADLEPVVVDLEPIAADLADAEAALARLDAGSYWTSEVSGLPLPDDLLAANPATRRLPGE